MKKYNRENPNDDLLLDTVIKILDSDYGMVIKGEPIYSLKECLYKLDNKTLLRLCDSFNYSGAKIKVNNNSSNDKMVDGLYNSIIDMFKDYVKTISIEDEKYFEDAIKNGKSHRVHAFMVMCGFMFAFKKGDVFTYIIPNEILDIYKEYASTDEKKTRDLYKAGAVAFTYLLMNGFMEKKVLDDYLISRYNAEIVNHIINNVLNKTAVFDEKYYTILQLSEEHRKEIEIFLSEKCDFPNIILGEAAVLSYYDLTCNLLEKIEKIVKDEHLTEAIFNRMIFANGALDVIPVDLPPKKSIEVYELYNDNRDKLRYWCFNGRTYNEYMLELFSSKCGSKPSNSSLECCLSKLDSDIYDMIADGYDIDKPLEMQILQRAEADAKNLGSNVLIELLSENNSTFINADDVEFLFDGFVFLYKDGDGVKYMIPDEVLKIFENYIFTKDDAGELVCNYLSMNGILERDKLIELLKEYHDIDVSLKNLDKIVKDHDINVVKGKYYSLMEDVTESDVHILINIKNKYGKYKKFNYEIINSEDSFFDEIDVIINDKVVPSNRNEVAHTIFGLSKAGVLSEKTLRAEFEDSGLSINSKVIKDIVNVYKKYKKYISIYAYNGFSATENAEMNAGNSIKVGRNDSCPCGSGKKYKKCCGK